jgi:hypothetical protein
MRIRQSTALTSWSWGVRALTHQAVSDRQHDHDDAAYIHCTLIAASLSQFHWPQYFQN